MSNYQETFDTWNKVAVLYQEKFMDLDLYNQSYDAICEALPNQNAKVLDIGCGPGNITRYLLSKRPAFKILGIDIAPNMIALAKQNNPTASFEIVDTRALHTLQQQFDAIIAGFCIPYLSTPDCEKLIADSSTHLHAEGILYLSFVEGDPKQSGFMAGSTGDRTYFYYHRTESITAILSLNGFETFKTYQIPFKKSNGSTEIHTIILSRKINHQ